MAIFRRHPLKTDRMSFEDAQNHVSTVSKQKTKKSGRDSSMKKELRIKINFDDELYNNLSYNVLSATICSFSFTRYSKFCSFDTGLLWKFVKLMRNCCLYL